MTESTRLSIQRDACRESIGDLDPAPPRWLGCALVVGAMLLTAALMMTVIVPVYTWWAERWARW